MTTIAPEAGADVLVFGDSQAEILGGELADELRRRGDRVYVQAHPGKTTAKLLQAATGAGKVSELPPLDPAAYDRAYVLAGGNDARRGGDYRNDVAGLVGLFSGRPVHWVGPAPQTRIGDLEYARRMFGSSVKSADHFLGDSAHAREAYNRTLGAQVRELGGDYLDLRDAGLGGPEQIPGVTFPTLGDGVHIDGETAKRSAAWIADETIGRKWGAAPYALIASLAALAVAGVAIYFIRRRRT